MSYTIRRWLSYGGDLDDDSEKVKTADEAIRQTEKLAGIYKSVVTDEHRQRIRDMQPGESFKIKSGMLKLTIIVRRTKR